MLDMLILHKNIQEELKKIDRRLASNLNYEGIEFPVQEKDFSKIEVENNICINVFGYEDELVFPIFISEQSLKILWIYCFYLKLINHIMYTLKILTHLCFIKRKKKKNSFVKVVYNVLVVKIS